VQGKFDINRNSNLMPQSLAQTSRQLVYSDVQQVHTVLKN